jgi:hypothetical protein
MTEAQARRPGRSYKVRYEGDACPDSGSRFFNDATPARRVAFELADDVEPSLLPT